MYGEKLMKKQGWEEGTGLGKNKQGVAEHVKVTRKDDTKGIGYSAAVGAQSSWSQHAQDFSDVLKRISGGDSADAKAAGKVVMAEHRPSDALPTAGKFSKSFDKRRKLKMGALADKNGRSEILGGGGQDSSDSDDDGAKETVVLMAELRSPTLQRLMAPGKGMTASKEGEAGIVVRKPDPKPPTATETPFLE